MIDYSIELPCMPRRTLGSEGLVLRLGRLEELSALDAPDDVDRRALQAEAFPLRPLAFHCRDCPANHLQTPFGCCGTLRLPLTAELETWLVQQLPVRARRSEPERAEQVAVQMRHVQRLVRHCRDRGIRGDPAAAARGGGILAATEPARWQWKAGLRRFQLDSSQLLEILLLSGRVGPAAAELVCRALGLWKDAGTAWDGMTQTMFTRPITREDSLELRELKQYFLALMFACSLDTTLQVRVTTGRRGAAAAAPGPAAHRERPQAWLSADERRTAALR